MNTQYRSYGRSDRSSSSGTLLVVLLSLVLGAVALAVFLRHVTTGVLAPRPAARRRRAPTARAPPPPPRRHHRPHHHLRHLGPGRSPEDPAPKPPRNRR